MSLRSLLFAILVTLGTAAGHASGQGTGRLFPAPLSFDEMQAWLAPLELSDAQREIAAAAHQSYLEQSLDLRHGRIAAYLEAHSEHDAYDPDIERRQIEEGVRRHRSLLGAIRVLDDALLDQIATALTDEQRTWVPRLRARRTRERQANEAMFAGFGRPALGTLDLTRHLAQIELDDATRDAIDPIVRDYESAINPSFRTVADLRLERPLAIHDRRIEQEAALAEHMAQQRERAEGESEVMYESFAFDPMMSSMGGDPRWGETLARVSRRNREALDALMPLMPAESFDDLERRYLRQAFASLRIPGDRLDKPIRRWLDANETSDAQPAVAALRASHRTAWRKGERAMIEAAEKTDFALGDSGYVRITRIEYGSAPDTEETPSKLDQARADLRTLLERSIESFVALTGETIETSPRARSYTMPGGGATFEVAGDGDMEIVVGVETVPAVGVLVVEAEGDGSGAQVLTVFGAYDGDEESSDGGAPTFRMPSFGDWLPDALDEALVSAMMADLDAAGMDAGVIVDVVYGDYLTAWETLDAEVIVPAETALRRGIGQVDEPAAAFTAVRDAAARIDDTEQAWFDDIRALTDGDVAAAAVRRCEWRRAFARAGHGGSGGQFTFSGLDAGGEDEHIDLWEIALETLDPAERSAITERLDAWLEEAARQRGESWSSRLAASEQQAIKLAEQRAEHGGGHSMFFGAPASNGSAALDHELALHTRRAVESILATLDDAAGQRFERAYFDAAYPSIFGTPSPLEASFRRAQELELDRDAASRLATLRVQWYAERDAVQRRMVDALRRFDDESGAASGFGPERFEAYQGFTRDQEALAFELRNLDERTRQSLRSILGPLAAAAGLADDDADGS